MVNFEEISEAYLTLIYDKDVSTYNHSCNVGLLARNFSKYLRMDEKEQLLMQYCGYLHDIGKLEISDSILKKTGKLNQKEKTDMYQHYAIGERLIEREKSKFKKNDYRIVFDCIGKHEYENYFLVDSVYVRIIILCDIYEALVSSRSYKQGYSLDTTFRIMMDQLHFGDDLYFDFKNFIYSDVGANYEKICS